MAACQHGIARYGQPGEHVNLFPAMNGVSVTLLAAMVIRRAVTAWLDKTS